MAARPRSEGKSNSAAAQAVNRARAAASTASRITSAARPYVAPPVVGVKQAVRPRAVEKSNPVPARSTASTSSSSGYSGGRVSSPASSYSGGSTGNFDGGTGGGFSSAAFSAPAEPALENLTIPDPLAQPAYQRAKAEMNRARGDFDAQQALAKSQYDAAFDDSQRQLGWRSAIPRLGLSAVLKGAGNDEAGFDPNAQGTAYGDAYSANQGDFAGRGLFNSGLYLQALSNMNSNFNDRRASALRDQKDWRDTQDLNKKNFYGQQDAADAAAQEDAISAIMASMGVGRDQVTPGRENIISRLASV